MIEEKTIVKIGWNFDNSYSRLPNLLFTSQLPIPVHAPKLMILNHKLAKSLGLNVQALQSDDAVAVFAGNQIPEGALPLAQAYAGHQFGHFTILGDGRAILLGEQITPMGERFDIQLKGSGRTPYSRGGDGRAAIGPMLREYIISEAMHALGIETTRSLAVVTTGEVIFREKELSGAILTRVARSHLRVGTFQYVSQMGTVDDLRTLADYTLVRHFPVREDAENPYIYLLQEVIKRQAALIAKWQLVGFVHGVMNTDNMTISGETIDYGPCAFMDEYDPATVFSSIDKNGRYAYGNQPQMAAWNLARFAETLLPILDNNQDTAVEIAQNAITDFSELYHNNWMSGMRSKLGIFNEEQKDEFLIDDLLSLMQKYDADYTNTFQALTCDKWGDIVLFGTMEFKKWHEMWQARLRRQKETIEASQKLMQICNPVVIPRNHRVEEALESAENKGDYSVMMQLLDAISNPYTYVPESDYYTSPEQSNHPYRTYCGT